MARRGTTGRTAGLRGLLAALLALGWLVAMPSAPAGAAAIPVTNTSDSGPGSLRAAIAAAEATPEADTITIGVAGTIQLASGLGTLTRPVTIAGPGRDALTIQGNQAFALLWFNAPGGPVTVGGVTFARGGRPDGSGGCLWVASGSVTLRDARVRDCVAVQGGGGILQTGGALTIERTELRGNVAGYEPTYGGGGGAIFANQSGGNATLTIRDSVIAGNTTDGSGGGIRAYRLQLGYSLTVTIERATISGNSSGGGGGIANVGSQGALTLTNVTLSDNTTGRDGGGIYNSSGTATLRFATVVGNVTDSDNNGFGTGGGLYHDSGTLSVLSSIVAGNHRDAGAANDCSGTITSQGRNLWGTQYPCPNNAALGDRNLVTLNVNLTQVLAPLADNGGPTPTHALVPGSPAIGHGDNVTCPTQVATDQRGVPRTDGQCDVGAYEYVPTVALTVAADGGTVARSPQGGGAGPFAYAPGTAVALTPQPAAGQAFVGWVVDGVARGWAAPLTLTMDADHSVQATFAPTVTFGDVGAGRPDHAAIVALASRGTIRGYADGRYGPDDGVQRAQMAALIARATPLGPGTPPTMLTPPACLVAGTWDCEDWGTAFTDQSGDPNLWRNAGALQHYGVALGYASGDCASKGRAFPCYGPSDPVTYAQTITFIVRMMKVTGYWLAQPTAPLPYANVPGPHQEDVRTFAFYTQGLGGIPAPPADWNGGASRSWFALALWQALDSYWGSDRPGAGGYVP